MSKFYRSVIRFEVLSEEPIPSDADLEYIARGANEGRYVGGFFDTIEKEITPKEAADALYEFGGDPSFFFLDDDGRLLVE